MSSRARWILLVALIGAGAVGLMFGIRSRQVTLPAAPDGDRAPSDATPAAVPEPRDAAMDSPGKVSPKSPIGAAVHYGDRLSSCFPSDIDQDVSPWGRGDSSAGVRFDVVEDGALLSAKLWGNAGIARSCLDGEIGKWPLVGKGKRAIRLDYPVSRPKFGRHPGGGLQFLVALHYYRQELSVADLKGVWWAICPRDGGADLVPTVVSATAAGEGEYAGWKVSAARCPGDQIVMVRGVGGPAGKAMVSTPGADAAHSEAKDGGEPAGGDGGVAELPPLPTVPVKPGTTIDMKGITLALGEKQLRIFLEAPDPENPDAGALVLQHGEVAQVLTTDGFGHELLWAGDLDGDGGLDLVISKNPDTPRYELFLSSKAGGRLVRRAATLQHLGD